MGAGSSRNQWEREVVAGRGLGVGAGNIAESDNDHDEARKQEEQKMKEVHAIVRRHSMLKQQLIDRAVQKKLEEEVAANQASEAGPEVDEDEGSPLAHGESFGARAHAQLLMNMKTEGSGEDNSNNNNVDGADNDIDASAGTAQQDSTSSSSSSPPVATDAKEAVRDFGELRARIALDSTNNTAFSRDDVDVEGRALEACFSSVALGLGLQQGQFECRVVDATVEDVEEEEEEEDGADGGEGKGGGSCQHNRLVFRLVIRFFTSDEGFSKPFCNKMHAFLGFERAQGDCGDDDQWVSVASPEPAPICAEFERVCESSSNNKGCVVRVGKVHSASLKLALGEDARRKMSP